MPERALDLGEAPWTVEEILDDEQGPFVANDGERASQILHIAYVIGYNLLFASIESTV
jgi:hypothetical protein